MSIQTYNLEQGTEEWFALRKGRLTASSYAKVVSSKSLKYAELIKNPRTHPSYISPTAKRQFEVFEDLVDGRQLTSSLNPSGLKGLVEKGVARVYEDAMGCQLNHAAALKHIDGLLADIYYKEDDLQPHKPSFAMERGTRLEELARIDFEMRMGIEVDEVGFITNSELGDHIGCSPDGVISGGNGGLEIKCPLPTTHLKYHREGVLPEEYKAQVHGCMAVSGADYWWFTSFCPNIKDFTLRVDRNDYTENLKGCLKEFNQLFIENKTNTQHLTQ